MPVILALLAILALLLSPATVAAKDLEPSTATPDVVIDIGRSVSPREVRVPAGSVVGWVNRDDDEHRVRSRSGPAEFDSGNLEPGERFAVRLTAPGTYAYVDDRERDDAAYHGRIIVTAASDAGGSAGAGSTGGGGGSTTGSSVSASIGDRVFSPSTIRVAAGGTVTWTNDDDREHTVTATDASFDSGVMDPGATHRERFPTPGTFAFLCALHPEMRGEVEVVGADGGAPPASTPPPTPTPAPVPAATPGPGGGAPATVTVEMRDFVFGPAAATVAAGGTVTFANVGAAPHTATADGGAFDTALVAAGATASITVAGPGTITFVCAFHPEMQGTIEVVATSTEATATPAAPAATRPSPSPSPTSSAASDGSSSGGGGSATGGDTTTGDGTPTGPRASSPTRALEGLVGLVVGVTLVSIAAALFARTINGAVRRPG